ncbi:HD domain-containing protein [Nocardioides zeicaulis]|uniref:Metal-dependent phosphohydrolase n=1 Tax=Nocardioides zeicaulis TaxID=1776857 RepID=A0ABV6E3L4_9ACTN
MSSGPALVAALAARWPLPDRLDLRDELLVAWDRPGYHDLLHLTEVLDRLDELADAGVPLDRTPVAVAAWFHDAVYDGAPDDEERSARWAERALTGPLATEVARLVRMTVEHRPDDDDTHGGALSDADLAILAAPPERYDAYVAGVRADFAHVGDDDFRAGRRAVLEDLIARTRLFRTGRARELWEERARANLARELARLRD